MYNYDVDENLLIIGVLIFMLGNYFLFLWGIEVGETGYINLLMLWGVNMFQLLGFSIIWGSIIRK